MGDQNRQDEKREKEKERVRKNTAGPFDSFEFP